jgi:YD repeat-containing protein
MGTLRSATDHTGMVVNGITLGQPVQDVDDDGEPFGYRWDDGRLPTGEIDESGVITVDETELM